MDIFIIFNIIKKIKSFFFKLKNLLQIKIILFFLNKTNKLHFKKRFKKYLLYPNFFKIINVFISKKIFFL